MQKVLEELYMGNIGFDSGYYGQNSAFSKAAHRRHDSMEKLMETLTESEKEIFEEYTEAQSDIDGMVRYAIYAAALKFGILLMVESIFDIAEPEEAEE